MRVFVTGGTGAIGRYAVSALVKAGHDVVALSRSDSSSAVLKGIGADSVMVSLFDRDALCSAFAGCDAVVNLATALPSSKDFHRSRAWVENNRIRTEGSSVVVDAALSAGVPKLIQESVVMIYKDGGDKWLDETWPVDNFPMAHSNLAAEASVDRFTRSGGQGIVMRFGWFYGRGAAHSEEFFHLAKRFGLSAMMGGADGYVSSIQVRDGGNAVAAALKVPAGTYNIVDNCPLTKKEYADAIAAGANRRRYIRAPGVFAKVMRDNTTSLTRSLRVKNEKFRAASGWSPYFPSAREGWRDMGLSSNLKERPE